MIRRLLPLVLTLAGCAPTEKPLTEADHKALADSLIQLASTMIADIDRHEVDKFIGYHDNVPGFAWATSGELVALDSMHQSMRAYFAGPEGREVHFSMGEAKAHPLGRNAGVVTAIVNSTSKDSTGSEQRSHQAWSIVVERRAGAWRVVQTHESYPRAP